MYDLIFTCFEYLEIKIIYQKEIFNMSQSMYLVTQPSSITGITTDINLMNDHIQSILIAISKNPVTNVVSLAGTGKSTDLPIGIADSGNNITVVVSDPGIARSLAKYVSSKTNLIVGNNIDNNNNITYISQKDLKNHLYKIISRSGCMDFSFTNILMIDEADSSSFDQTIIELLWRYCAEQRARVPKLLLVSSTIINTKIFDIETYKVETIMYPIEIRYSDKNYPTRPYHHNQLVSDTINLIYHTHTSNAQGDILVFTTGEAESESITQLLKDMKIEGADIFAAHGSLDMDSLDEIYEPTANRRIVIADSLAETTFTLRDLGIIIDMMVDYQPELNLTGGIRYPKRYITKHRANLRSSRGGRYQPLLCYRMMTKILFDKLRDHTQSMIFHIPIHNIMLELIDNGIKPYDILNIFPKKELDYNYNMMVRLGVIDITGSVTELGNFTRELPLGLRNSVALYRWLELKVPPYPAIVLLSMIDSFGKSYFVYPLREYGLSHTEYNLEMLEHRKRHFNPFEGKSDIHTYSNIWNIMMDEVGGPNVPSSDIIDWCEDNSIRYDIISEVMTVIHNITEILKTKVSGNIEIGPFNTDNTLRLLGPILANVYSDRLFKYVSNGGVRVRYEDNDGKYYKIDSQNSINSIEREIPDIVYGLITSTISSKYGADFHMISCSLVL